MKTLLFTECVDMVGLACKPFSGTKKYVSTGAVDVDHINDSDTEIVDYDGKPSRANLEAMAGDVLFAKMQGTKKTLLIDSVLANHIYSTGFCAVRAKKGILTERCLYHLLTSEMFLSQKDKNCSGATQKAITNAGLGKIVIHVPSIEEQDDIADQLDTVINIITKRQQELAALDDLIKARFVEMFGDPVLNPNKFEICPLQELIDNGIITYHLDGNHGGDYPKSEEFVDTGVPYIGANSIKNGTVDIGIAKYLTEERAGRLRKGIARNGDVLFAHNATVGPVAVLVTTEEKVILSTSLTAYRCNQNYILPNYLKAYMQSEGFVRQYSGEMKQTTRNQVPITAQRKYLFMVAPMDMQKNFEMFAEQVDKSKVAVQKALDKAQILFDSLMQDYFG